MPRGPAPLWTQHKSPDLRDWVRASVTQCGGKHDGDGHYAELHITGCDTRDEAREYVRALHRAGRGLHRRGELAVGIKAKIEAVAGGGFTVRFNAVDKEHARQNIIAKYGPDPSKWPYNPYRKGTAA